MAQKHKRIIKKALQVKSIIKKSQRVILLLT
jgi:hypothetical protein